MTSTSRSNTHSPAPERSFEERLAAARTELEAYARRLLPAGQGLAGAHRDHEDLVQDALQRALARRASFDASRPMLPWLKRLLLRVFLDQRKRLLASPEGQRPEVLADPVCEHSESDSDRLGVRELVARLLARIDEPERGILERFHLRGDSIERIAGALGLPEGTVKSHLHRARRRLATGPNPHATEKPS